MGEIQWIKLSTDFFGDDKIKQIRAMPEGDAMLLIWLNLLVMAGKTNDGGLIYLTKELPYNDEMFSVAMNRPVGIVRSAINIFKTLHMVEDTPDGLLISNWEKHQNVDGMERAREQSKLRMRNYRERKRLEAGQKEDCYVTVTQQVTPCSTDVTRQNKKEDIEEDIELRDNNVSFSDENDCRTDLRQIAEKWNELGVSPVKKLTSSSARGKMISARIREYGLDTVLQAIDNIKLSPFLRGENKNGWMVTIDWFAKPNNFIKVSEGQYNGGRTGQNRGTSSADRIRAMIERGEFKE